MDSDDPDAQATASFVRDKPRSRLDEVSFYDDGKTRDSAEERASDRRRAVTARKKVAKKSTARKKKATPRKSETSDDGFELVGVQTAEERAEANRQRAVHEGAVLEVDDDASDAPPPPGYVCALRSDGADGERVGVCADAAMKFGRALDNDVRVPLAKCSRLHAELTTDGRVTTLQNHARAADTTLLRGASLKPKEAREVNDGDVFEICGRRFRFEAAAVAAPVAQQQAPTVDVDLTGDPDSQEEPDFSPDADSPPLDSDVDFEEDSESEEEEESDDDSRAGGHCYRCGGTGH